MDLATLNIQVNTSQVKDAADKLNTFAESAGGAEKATDSLKKTWESMSKASTGLEKLTDKELKDYSNELNKASQGTESFSQRVNRAWKEISEGARKDLDSLTQKVNESRKNHTSFGSTIMSIVPSLGALAAGYISLKSTMSFLKDSANEFMQTEVALNRLTVAMKNSKSYTFEGVESFKQLADVIQRTTTVSDTAAISIMGIMKSYGMSNEEVKKATQAALDFASAKAAEGLSATAAARLIARAYEGHTERLGRYGIEVDKAATASQKFDSVLSQITSKFSGSASQDLNTYSGQLTQLSNLWGSFQTDIGQIVMQLSGPFISALRGVISLLKETSGWWAEAFRMPTNKEIWESQRKSLLENIKALKDTQLSTGKFADPDTPKRILELENRYNSLTGAIKSLAKEQEKANYVVKEFTESRFIEKYSSQIKSAGEVKIFGVDELKKEEKAYEELTKNINRLRMTEVDFQKWALQEETNERIKNAGGNQKIIEAATQFQILKIKEIMAEQSKAIAATQGLVKDKGWEDYAAGLNDAGEAARQLSRNLIDATSNASKFFDVAKSTELIKELGWEDYASGALEGGSKIQREINQAAVKAMREAGGDTLSKDVERVWDQALRNIQDKTADVFKDIFDGNLDSWEDFGDAILDIMKDTLSQIASLYLQQKIVLPIMSEFGVGPQTGSGMGASGGIGGSLSGVVGDIGGSLTSAFNWIGDSISGVLDTPASDLEMAAENLNTASESLSDYAAGPGFGVDKKGGINAGGMLTGAMTGAGLGYSVSGGSNTGAALGALFGAGAMAVGMINPIAGAAVAVAGMIVSALTAETKKAVTQEIVSGGFYLGFSEGTYGGSQYQKIKQTTQKTKGGMFGGGTKTSIEYKDEFSQLTNDQISMLNSYTKDFRKYIDEVALALDTTGDLLSGVSLSKRYIELVGPGGKALSEDQIKKAIGGFYGQLTEEVLKGIVGYVVPEIQDAYYSSTYGDLPVRIELDKVTQQLDIWAAEYLDRLIEGQLAMIFESPIRTAEELKAADIQKYDQMVRENIEQAYAMAAQYFEDSYNYTERWADIWHKYESPQALVAAKKAELPPGKTMGSEQEQTYIDMWNAFDNLVIETFDEVKEQLNFVLNFRKQIKVFEDPTGILEQELNIQAEVAKEVDPLLVSLTTFFEKTATLMTPADLEAASTAVTKYVESLLSGRKGMTETQAALYTLDQRFEQFKKVLLLVGYDIDAITGETTNADLLSVAADFNALWVKQKGLLEAQRRWADDEFEMWQKGFNGAKDYVIVMEELGSILGWNTATTDELTEKTKAYIEQARSWTEAKFAEEAAKAGLSVEGLQDALVKMKDGIYGVAESATDAAEELARLAAEQRNFKAWQYGLQGLDDFQVALKMFNMTAKEASTLVGQVSAEGFTLDNFKAMATGMNLSQDELTNLIDTLYSGLEESGSLAEDFTDTIKNARETLLRSFGKYGDYIMKDESGDKSGWLKGLVGDQPLDEVKVFAIFEELNNALKGVEGETNQVRITTEQYEYALEFLSDTYENQKDAALELVEKQQEIADQKAGLELELLQMEVKTKEMRELELAALDETLVALQKRVWALQGEQEWLSVIANLEAERSGEKSFLDQSGDITEKYRQAFEKIQDLGEWATETGERTAIANMAIQAMNLELDILADKTTEADRNVKEWIMGLNGVSDMDIALERFNLDMAGATELIKEVKLADTSDELLTIARRFGVGTEALMSFVDTVSSGMDELERKAEELDSTIKSSRASLMQTMGTHGDYIMGEKKPLITEAVGLDPMAAFDKLATYLKDGAINAEQFNYALGLVSKGIQDASDAIIKAQEEMDRKESEIVSMRTSFMATIDQLTLSEYELRDAELNRLEVIDSSLPMLQMTVWALEDEKKAKEKQLEVDKAIAEERKGLQDELDSLIMTETELRAKQLTSLDESNRSLQEQVWIADDLKKADEKRIEIEKEIAEERKGLQDELDSLLMTEVELRAKQLVSIDESNRALQEQVWVAEDLKKANEKLMEIEKERTDAINSARESLMKELGTYGDYVMGEDKPAITEAVSLEPMLAFEKLADYLKAGTINAEQFNYALGLVSEKIQKATDAAEKAEAEMEERNANVMSNRASLMATIDQLTLSEYELRDAELARLEAIDASLPMLQMTVWALEDQKKALEETAQKEKEVADERVSLQNKLDELLMTEAQLRTKQLDLLDPINWALQEQIWATEISIEATERLAETEKAIADERQSLQNQIDQLLMTETELRDKELSLLDPSNKALQERIWALESEKEAAEKLAEIERAVTEERKGLQDTLDSLLMTETELRAKELALLDPTNQALQTRIWSLEDEKILIEELAEGEKVIANERAGLQEQLDQLTMSEEELRQVELARLEEIDRLLPLMQMTIWALEEEKKAREKKLEDDKAIADERKGLQDTLDSLLMTETELRKKELDLLDPSNKALQERIWAIEDEREALEKLTEAQKEKTDAIASAKINLMKELGTYGDYVMGDKKPYIEDTISSSSPMAALDTLSEWLEVGFIDLFQFNYALEALSERLKAVSDDTGDVVEEDLSELEQFVSSLYSVREQIAMAAEEEFSTLASNILGVRENFGALGMDLETANALMASYVTRMAQGEEVMTDLQMATYEANVRIPYLTNALIQVGWSAQMAADMAQDAANRTIVAAQRQFDSWLMGIAGISNFDVALKMMNWTVAQARTEIANLINNTGSANAAIAAFAATLGMTAAEVMGYISDIASELRSIDQKATKTISVPRSYSNYSPNYSSGSNNVSSASNALAEAARELEARFKSLSDALDGIKEMIEEMTFGKLAPAQSAEKMQYRYDYLLRAIKEATAEEDKAKYVQELNSFLPEYLDFMNAFGVNYQELHASVLEDLKLIEMDFTTELDYLSGILKNTQAMATAMSNLGSNSYSGGSYSSGGGGGSGVGIGSWGTEPATSSYNLACMNNAMNKLDTVMGWGSSSASSAKSNNTVGVISSTTSIIPLSTGTTIKQYQRGGRNPGGWRLAGEAGPELEFTGPSRIYDTDASSRMIADAVREAIGSGGGGQPITVIVKVGERELKDIVVETMPKAIRTNPSVQHEMKRVMQ